MRKPLVFLAAALLLAACSSGTRVVYVPSPSPVQVPPPDVQTIVPPVGITIVRADQSRLLVSTNQPAYVAVFEIMPGQGVTLVYPASARLRQVEHSGTSSLPVVWQSQRADASKGRYASNNSSRRNPNGYGQRPRVRYVYAIASDRPLRLTDGAFDDESLRSALGARVYRAVDPYETIDALAQHFVPRQMDEDWGEDLITIELARSGAPVRVAKVYCPGGSVVYVRDDLVDRAACPPRSRVRGTGTPAAAAPRPDSIVTSSGDHVLRPVNQGRRALVFRVRKPIEAQPVGPQNGSPTGGSPAAGNGGTASGNSSNGNGKAKKDEEHHDNGRHVGWDKTRNDSASSASDNGARGNAKGIGVNGNAAKGNPAIDDGEKGNGARGNAAKGNDAKGNDAKDNDAPSTEARENGKPERVTENAPSESKPDQETAVQPNATAKQNGRSGKAHGKPAQETAEDASADDSAAAPAAEKPRGPEGKSSSASSSSAKKRQVAPETRADSSADSTSRRGKKRDEPIR